jgi:hypothetical protein
MYFVVGDGWVKVEEDFDVSAHGPVPFPYRICTSIFGSRSSLYVDGKTGGWNVR